MDTAPLRDYRGDAIRFPVDYIEIKTDVFISNAFVKTPNHDTAKVIDD